jgi:hypothetical protein
MAKVKISSNLFLEVAELNRLKSFLDDNGFREMFLNNSARYGLFNNRSDNVFTNGLITNGSAGTISQAALVAVDNNGQLIVKDQELNISVPDDNQWYWIKISHSYSPNEVGVVAVDANGNLTGVGTKFTEVLRGQPNFPSRIRFTNAANNILEYDVLEVIDDQNAILTGVFSSEIDLKFSVVGTFTPGYNPPSIDKDIFQYDSCTLSLVLETVSNTRPTYTTDTDFFLARVKLNTGVSSVVTIQDKRDLNIYQTKPGFMLSDIIRTANPLIGVEGIKFDNTKTTKESNILYLAWAFRSSNFSVDTNTNKVTINSGQGGKFKSTADFTDGDFNGWRLYSENGKYSIITASSKTGSQINLLLDQLNVDNYSSNGGVTFLAQQLLVTPNAEQIVIKLTPEPTDNVEVPASIHTFPINQDLGKIRAIVYKDPTCLYNVKYQYKHIKEYSSLLTIPSDTAGYYAESQYGSDDQLIGSPTRTAYIASSTSGFIQLTMHASAYTRRIASIDLGDKLGVATFAIQNTPDDYTLIVGTNYQYEYISGSNYTLNNNKSIILNNGVTNGNFFLLHIKQKLTLGVYSFTIKDQALNVLKTFTQKDIDFINTSEQGMFIRAEWDGTTWILNSTNETRAILYRDSKMASPAISPGSGISITYTDVLTFDTLPNNLKNVHFHVGLYLTTSNGGGGAFATIGVAIKKNGTLLTDSDKNNIVVHSDFFLNNYSYFLSFNFKIVDNLAAGDIIKLMYGTIASFTPIATVERVSCEMTAEVY